MKNALQRHEDKLAEMDREWAEREAWAKGRGSRERARASIKASFEIWEKSRLTPEQHKAIIAFLCGALRSEVADGVTASGVARALKNAVKCGKQSYSR